MREPPLSILESFAGRVARTPGGRLVIACPADAAGWAAGELARRWFVARGAQPTIITPHKAELLIGETLAARAHASGAEALLALDLGAGAAAILPQVSTLFIDHHRHEANLAAGVIAPQFDADARPAGVVLYELIISRAGAMSAGVRRHAAENMAADDGRHGTPNSGDESAFGWLAAIAAEAGHPKTVPPEAWFGPTRGARRAVREAAVLLNAAGRASEPRAAEALALLARSAESLETAGAPEVNGLAGAEKFLADDSPAMQALRAARAEALRESAHWSRTRPHFMWRVALIPVASACRIEPIIAAMWARQLKGYMIVVANSGYAAGLVTITARTAAPERNLLRLLDAVTPPGLAGPFALGRRDYVEAVLPRDAWKAMLAKMRFRQAEKLVPPPQEAELF